MIVNCPKCGTPQEYIHKIAPGLRLLCFDCQHMFVRNLENTDWLVECYHKGTQSLLIGKKDEETESKYKFMVKCDDCGRIKEMGLSFSKIHLDF